MQPPEGDQAIGAADGDDQEIGGGTRPPGGSGVSTPSVYLFRGSLLALLVVSIVAVYLVLSPPEAESTQESVIDAPTSTPAITATATPTPEGLTPTPTPTLAPTETPTPEGPTPTPSPEPRSTIEYEVQPGDFLSTIAADHNTTVEAIVELNAGIDPDNISVGQVILIPAR